MARSPRRKPCSRRTGKKSSSSKRVGAATRRKTSRTRNIMSEVDIDILVEKYYKAGEINEPGQPRRWKCGVTNCGSTLKSLGIYNIRRHLKTHVVDEQLEHECPLCHKSFTQKSNMQTHVRTHIKLKCDNHDNGVLCKYEYCDPGSLTRHNQTKHGWLTREEEDMLKAGTVWHPQDKPTDDAWRKRDECTWPYAASYRNFVVPTYPPSQRASKPNRGETLPLPSPRNDDLLPTTAPTSSTPETSSLRSIPRIDSGDEAQRPLVDSQVGGCLPPIMPPSAPLASTSLPPIGQLFSESLPSSSTYRYPPIPLLLQPANGLAFPRDNAIGFLPYNSMQPAIASSGTYFQYGVPYFPSPSPPVTESPLVAGSPAPGLVHRPTLVPISNTRRRSPSMSTPCLSPASPQRSESALSPLPGTPVDSLSSLHGAADCDLACNDPSWRKRMDQLYLDNLS